ncbi:hypothetical protein K1719_008653 [Acacia pycnantha]|nr:hypothetical protein K1719_008653 [Acacia pycnantha]
MAVTKDAIAHFDWSSFILQELCEEIQEFKKDSQKSKRKQSKTVAICLYFLTLFCFQNFPLGDVIPSPHESPMAFWTDQKVKSRVLVEKRSKKGLLCERHTHDRYPTCNKKCRRFKDTLSEEGQHKGDAANNQPTTSEESDDDDEDGHDIEEGDDMDEGDQPENIIDVEEIPQHGEETPHVDGGLGGEHERKSKGKRTYDEKDTLFEMCTKSVSEDEAAEEFVDMHHYFLTRKELQCLNPRAWINNKLMTMVAKTLVADQLENGGVVHRHIFTADFMDKMISAERKWTVQSNVAEILPEHVGYNIGDCHFLFGPTLFLNHWFCYVLDTRTMVFYALDSLVEIRTYYRMQHEKENPTQLATKKKAKKKTDLDKAKEFMANKVPFRRMGSS